MPLPPWITELKRLRRQQNPARYGSESAQPTIEIPSDEPPDGWQPPEKPEPPDVIVIQV